MRLVIFNHPDLDGGRGHAVSLRVEAQNGNTVAITPLLTGLSPASAEREVRLAFLEAEVRHADRT